MGLKKLAGKTWTHWQWYKNFFQITVFKYLVTWFAVVPILAKLLMGIPEKIEIQTAKVFTVVLHLALPFKWELLWLSSLMFVIAFVLYKIFCPRFITTYSSFSDYKLYDHSPRWIVWESADVVKNEKELPKFFERLLKKEYLTEEQHKTISEIKPFVNKNQTELHFNYNNKTYSLALPRLDASGNIDTSATQIAEKEIFWEVFGRFSSSKSTVRLIIIGLLIVSLILFSIVLTQNIWTGLVYLFQ